MYKLKAEDGTNNICGKNLKRIRKAQVPPMSQRKLAQKLQIIGVDLDNHFIMRIENGERFVTDIEIKKLAEVLNIDYKDLLD